MGDKKSLKDWIAERAEGKGLGFERVLQLTEIPRHYLEALFRGQWQKLPAAPYVRGYLKKIEVVLDLELNSLWDLYKEEIEPKSSGPTDKLPENRYALKSKQHNWLWPTMAVVVLGLYLVLNLDRLTGLPRLEIKNPLAATVISTQSFFLLEGKIDSADKLFINGEEIYVDKTGQFQENYNLQLGLNSFEFIVKKFLGREIKVVKQIIYKND